MNNNIEEQNYLHLMAQIINEGEDREDRTGVGTKSLFGTTLRFSLANNTLPLLTTKKMFLKGIVEELLFFIRGETNTKKLEEKGVKIWKGNTSREFLDSRGLKYLPEGDMGKGYGFQWRRFGQHENDYGDRLCDTGGVDQLKLLIDEIKNNPFSRRHILTAWNPQQLNEMALPPCHIFCQFYVSKNKELSCQWYQRSIDYFLGLPFNMASYSILTHIIAKATGLTPKELIFTGGDTHAYHNTFNQCAEQLTRHPYPFPKINIKKDIQTLEDIERLQFEDFELLEYQSHPAIKAVMSI